MSDAEREDTIRTDVLGNAVTEYQSGRSVDARKLNPAEFDEWLKHTIIKYRYPIMGTAIISAGWLAYRFVKRILNRDIKV